MRKILEKYLFKKFYKIIEIFLFISIKKKSLCLFIVKYFYLFRIMEINENFYYSNLTDNK